MNLPAEAISEFRELYRNKCGVLLNPNDAAKQAENFLRLMALLTIDSQNENEKLHQNTK